MAGSAGVDSRQDRLQLISAIGLAELMTATAKSVEIVLAIGIRMPKVKQCALYRLALPI
jgi:hypothetical protein